MAQTSTGVTKGNDATEVWADAVVADITELYTLANPSNMNYAYNSVSTDGAAITTTNTSDTDIHANLSLSITTTGGPVLVIISGGGWHNDTDAKQSYLVVDVDGSGETMAVYFSSTGNSADDITTPFCAMKVVTGLSAASHTFKARHRTASGGTSRFANGKISMMVMELKK